MVRISKALEQSPPNSSIILSLSIGNIFKYFRSEFIEIRLLRIKMQRDTSKGEFNQSQKFKQRIDIEYKNPFISPSRRISIINEK